MKGREENSWKTIREEIFRRINDRVWQPGELIPGEADLAEEFGCARTTVHRALRGLADAGFLERRRKAGTRVAVHPARKATLTIPIARLEVERKGGVYEHRLLERRRKSFPAPLRDRLDLPDGVVPLFTRAIHFSDGRPYIYEERFTNVEAVPEIMDVDLTAVSANEWLVENAPYTHGRLTFFAENADAEKAERLATKEGTALFMAERSTWNGAMPITLVTMAYAPGHRMVTTI